MLFFQPYYLAGTSVNYENEKDASNGHIAPTAASQHSATHSEWRNSDGAPLDHIKPVDTLSVGSSVNYFVPSDSDIEDDLQDSLANALPSKIPQ